MGRCQVAAQNLDAEFHRLDIFGYVAVCYGERPSLDMYDDLFIKHAVKMLITRGYIDQQNKLVFVVVGKLFGYGSEPIITPFRWMNIHQSCQESEPE